MKIYAFQGTRYNGDADQAGQNAAPPFDQIDDTLRDRLHARSTHQFAHLTRPTSDASHSAQEAALRTHASWLDQGASKVDEEPSLYPYSIQEPSGARRLGLCALVDVRPGTEGDLRPHELTVDKPLADRLALLEQMRVDLEPVFYLADDHEQSLEKLLQEDVAGSEALAVHTDPVSGDAHELFRVIAPERIARYKACLEPQSAAIADGHHRTKTAQLFTRKHSPPEGVAAGAKMAVITSLHGSELQIDPIHRHLLVDVDLDGMRQLTRTAQPAAASNASELAREVAALTEPALGVQPAGGAPELWILDPDAAPADTPGRDARLPVVLLHHHLLEAVGVPLEASRDGSIAYRSDPADLDGIDSGTAIVLPPMDPAAFGIATSGGDVLPPKSTRFLPKLVSGLVWCQHSAKLG